MCSRRDPRTMACMRLTIPLLATSVALLLVPAAAQAGTVSYSGDTLVFQAAPGERNSPFFDKADDGRLSVLEEGTTFSAGCEQEFSWGPAYCTMPARVVVHLGDGDDGVGAGTDFPAIPLEIYGEDGKDILKAYGATNALMDGGPGNDELKGWQTDETLRGGPGDDVIEGSGGNDHIEAGEGNDTLHPDTYYGPGNDYVDGGPGFDLIDDYTIPSADYHPPVSLSMDGVANDGRPGETDNVINVEKSESHVSGAVVGGDGDDDFRIFANLDEGNSTMVGNGGNDKLFAGDYTDTVDGGPGNDNLSGGFGNDTITGGPGQDTIQGDANSTTCGYWSYTCKIAWGNDVINARDGEVDNIDCGVGTDQAIVDTTDVVANCETVDGAPPAQPSGPAKPGAAFKFSAKAVGKKKLSVTVPCAGACKVSATLTASGKKLATGRKTLLKSGNAKLTLKFAKPRRNVTATLKVTVESADGKTSASKKVKLKR
jgi:Ca2+-binding RTX toxin-like protein